MLGGGGGARASALVGLLARKKTGKGGQLGERCVCKPIIDTCSAALPPMESSRRRGTSAKPTAVFGKMVFDRAPVNVLKDGADPPLKPNAEYPAWLWKQIEPRPTLVRRCCVAGTAWLAQRPACDVQWALRGADRHWYTERTVVFAGGAEAAAVADGGGADADGAADEQGAHQGEQQRAAQVQVADQRS